MSDKEFNLKSTTIEKGLDLVKDLIDKLFSPAIGEVGGLLADKVKFLRTKQQIEILIKTKEYINKKNIDVKQIPLKILVPFMEMASLEEDEQLQDKWAKMLANMVDSDTNLQNQIFPYILSQLSIEEFDGLKKISAEELAYYQLRAKVNEKKRIISEQRKKDVEAKIYKAYPNTMSKEADEVERIRLEGFMLRVQEYEKANLIRLGLVRQLPPKIYIEEFSTGGDRAEGREEWHNLEAEYDPDEFGYRLTELGDLFLDICEIKSE